MVVEVLTCSATGFRFIIHDDVLTREMVESYRGCTCMVTKSRGIEFSAGLRGEQACYRYPLVAAERIVPLLKLMVTLEIMFSAPEFAKVPQPWRDVKPSGKKAMLTKEQRRDALMAAGRRVLAYKASSGKEDPNDAFMQAEDGRAPDIW